MAQAENCTEEEMKLQLKKQYDGYHFSKNMTDIYNPFSVLNAFDSKDVRDFWFATGTPTYLIRLMNHFNEGIDELTGKYYRLDEFVNYKADAEYPLPMIYQSGYLTIKHYDKRRNTFGLDFPHYDKRRNTFGLDFPNNEVKSGFLTMVANNYLQSRQDNNYLQSRQDSCNTAQDLAFALEDGELDQFRQMLTAFLASIPYTMRRKDEERERERYFQYTFYLLLRLMSVYCCCDS